MLANKRTDNVIGRIKNEKSSIKKISGAIHQGTPLGKNMCKKPKIPLRNRANNTNTVNEIIANKGLAIGMTSKEVKLSRGEPTKTTVRITPTGESGSWEYINYNEIKHYITKVDPVSGQAFRQLSHTTREETGKTTVEFKDGAVSALEEMEDKGAGNVKIIIPPVVFGW